MTELVQGFNTAAHDSNPGPLTREPESLPLSHCALHCIVQIYLQDDCYKLHKPIGFIIMIDDILIQVMSGVWTD